MSRVIHVDNPGKRRNQARRSSPKSCASSAAKARSTKRLRDMAAMLVFLLHEIKGRSMSRPQPGKNAATGMKVERFVQDWE